MCEVEFWEVFLRKEQEHFIVVPYDPLVDCRIADLEVIIRRLLCLSILVVKELSAKIYGLAVSRQYRPARTAIRSFLIPA